MVNMRNVKTLYRNKQIIVRLSILVFFSLQPKQLPVEFVSLTAQ